MIFQSMFTIKSTPDEFEIIRQLRSIDVADVDVVPYLCVSGAFFTYRISALKSSSASHRCIAPGISNNYVGTLYVQTLHCN